MKRILTISDAPDQAHVFQNLFGEPKVAVDLVPSYVEAKPLMEKHPYHLVFLDLRLYHQGLRGVPLLRALRHQHPALLHVPVFALTACSLPGERSYCLQSGFSDYFVFPLDPSSLRQAVVQVFPEHL
ncbi:MAG: response regulator [Bacteroidetes bacterium]|nr:MAG: response regulator [Bacteroidota bacterium]